MAGVLEYHRRSGPLIGTAAWQSEGEQSQNAGMDIPQHPCARSQGPTESTVHDGCLPQRVTDSSKVAIGHHSIQEAFSASTEMEEGDLGDTDLIQNEGAHKVQWHFRTGHRRETHVKNRQVPQEKIHGRVKASGKKNSHKDRHISQQGAGIEGQEQDKNYSLQPLCVWNSQQDEFGHHRAILLHESRF